MTFGPYAVNITNQGIATMTNIITKDTVYLTDDIKKAESIIQELNNRKCTLVSGATCSLKNLSSNDKISTVEDYKPIVDKYMQNDIKIVQ